MVTAGDGVLIVSGVIAFGAPNRTWTYRLQLSHRTDRNSARRWCRGPCSCLAFVHYGFRRVFLTSLAPCLGTATFLWGEVML